MPDVQIFVSYARDDNDLPPDRIGRGFVDYFHEHLAHEFKLSGPQRPVLWRDTHEVLDVEQFGPKIAAALDSSQILLVVLSPNWLASKYCQLELKTFAQRWRDLGEDAEKIRHRIVWIGTRNVDRDRLPSLLQGQVGIQFYARDDHGMHRDFFKGKIVDDRYHDRMAQLVRALLIFSARFGGWRDDGAIVLPNGHTVFVAKPADDMNGPYRQIVRELVERGCAVVPDPAEDIPTNSSAVTFIDRALAAAEASVHVLGEGGGFAPEGHQEGVVRLQLQRAAIRVSALPPSDDIPGREFHRIIWAPRALENGVSGRDPMDVLKRFHEELPNDKVEGSGIAKFKDFLVPHIIVPRVVQPTNADQVAADIKPGMRVYVHHAVEDSDYAIELRDLLAKRDVVPVLPVFEADSQADLANYHRKELARCDAVLVCWAEAREMWARQRASELGDWHALGRVNKFAYRGVVAGPPGGGRKKYAEKVFPPDEIDIVLNLTAFPHPTPEALDPLFTSRR